MVPDEERPPPAFLCPIMGELMRDPVTCADGHSYERSNIARWLAEHDTSPVTGATLPSHHLIPNHALRNAIEDFEDSIAKQRLTAPLEHVIASPRLSHRAEREDAAGVSRPALAPESTNTAATDREPAAVAAVAAVAGAAAPSTTLDDASEGVPDADAATVAVAMEVTPADTLPVVVASYGADAAESAADISNEAAVAGPLDVGIQVLYTQGDGQQRAATIVAVNPGPPEDPEPSYTIALDDGNERDTIRSRLVPVVIQEADPVPEQNESPMSHRDMEQDFAAHAAEELARREAVERSRLEARQARAERRVAAEQAAAAHAGSQSSRERPASARQQQRRSHPSAGYHHTPRQSAPFPGMPSFGMPSFGGASPFGPPRAQRASHPAMPPGEDPFQAAGQMFDEMGRAIGNTFDEIGRAATGFFMGMMPNEQSQQGRNAPR